jgi:hypothetical protein
LERGNGIDDAQFELDKKSGVILDDGFLMLDA